MARKNSAVNSTATDHAIGSALQTIHYLSEAIELHARMRPDELAFICEGETASWQQFSARVRKVAEALVASGIRPGDKVALLGASSLCGIEVFFGVVAAGACIVPLAASVMPEALRSMIRDADTRMLIVGVDARSLLDGFVEDLKRELPRGLIALDFEEAGWTAFEEWIAPAGLARMPALSGPDADFNIIYSSGTTGTPKGILHSAGMRLRQAVRRNYDLGPDTVNLLATPLYSNTTLQPMLATLAHGGMTILMRKFDAASYLALAESHGATHTMLVPVQYQRILAHPAFDTCDLSSFLFKQSTGAPMRPSLKDEIIARWPGRLIEVYGMTEGGSTCILDVGAFPHKIATVGRPAPDHDIRIIDAEGKEVPNGETGEVVGHSPFMMTGYYRQAEKTQEIYWRDEQGRVFHKTGDIGKFDEDGFLVLLDRKKDMIISGGFNIYAVDLEQILATHPDVEDVAVIGVPSEAWGETPLALVVLRENALVDPSALCEWVNRQVGKTQRLSAVEFRESLARSSLGKLQKHALRSPYWRK